MIFSCKCVLPLFFIIISKLLWNSLNLTLHYIWGIFGSNCKTFIVCSFCLFIQHNDFLSYHDSGKTFLTTLLLANVFLSKGSFDIDNHTAMLRAKKFFRTLIKALFELDCSLSLMKSPIFQIYWLLHFSMNASCTVCSFSYHFSNI